MVDRLAFCSLQIKQIEDKHAQQVGKIKTESMAASAKYQEQLEAADEEQNTLYDVALGKHLAMVQEHEDELRDAKEGAAAMMQEHEDELRNAKEEAAVQLDAAVEQVKAGLDKSHWYTKRNHSWSTECNLVNSGRPLGCSGREAAEC